MGVDLKSRSTILLLLFIFSPFSIAKTIDVVVGLAKPPYVISKDVSGYEIELIQAVLAKIDYKANFIFIPFGRSVKMLKHDNIDAIMTMNEGMVPDKEQLSNVYINYQNVAITLKKNNIILNTITDLSSYYVASFQLAPKILGEQFANAVQKSPLFVEIADQSRQVKLLYEERFDVIVMDLNIFKHLAEPAGGLDDFSDIDIHYIFGISPYRMVFKDVLMVTRFNAALAEFKQSTQFQQLVEKYKVVLF